MESQLSTLDIQVEEFKRKIELLTRRKERILEFVEKNRDIVSGTLGVFGILHTELIEMIFEYLIRSKVACVCKEFYKCYLNVLRREIYDNYHSMYEQFEEDFIKYLFLSPLRYYYSIHRKDDDYTYTNKDDNITVAIRLQTNKFEIHKNKEGVTYAYTIADVYGKYMYIVNSPDQNSVYASYDSYKVVFEKDRSLRLHTSKKNKNQKLFDALIIIDDKYKSKIEYLWDDTDSDSD
jgi:hypothetical protein